MDESGFHAFDPSVRLPAQALGPGDEATVLDLAVSVLAASRFHGASGGGHTPHVRQTTRTHARPSRPSSQASMGRPGCCRPKASR